MRFVLTHDIQNKLSIGIVKHQGKSGKNNDFYIVLFIEFYN